MTTRSRCRAVPRKRWPLGSRGRKEEALRSLDWMLHGWRRVGQGRLVLDRQGTLCALTVAARCKLSSSSRFWPSYISILEALDSLRAAQVMGVECGGVTTGRCGRRGTDR